MAYRVDWTGLSRLTDPLWVEHEQLRVEEVWK